MGGTGTVGSRWLEFYGWGGLVRRSTGIELHGAIPVVRPGALSRDRDFMAAASRAGKNTGKN